MFDNWFICGRKLVIGGAEVGEFVWESLIGYYTFLDNLAFLRMGYMDYNF
jgi:hypothetical protein